MPANSSCFAAQGCCQMGKRGDQVSDDPERGRQVDRGREHIVRRLGSVGLVIRANLSPELFTSEIRQYFIHIHVCRGTRAGLEDVDRELIKMAPICHFIRGLCESYCDITFDRPHLGVHDGRGTFDHRQCDKEGGIHRLAGDRKVLHSALCLRSPARGTGNANLTHRIVLNAVFLRNVIGTFWSCQRHRLKLPVSTTAVNLKGRDIVTTL